MTDLQWTSETEWANAQTTSNVSVDGGSFSLASAILDSVIGYWPGDEGVGGTLDDNIGTADISLNGPTWVQESSFAGGYAISYEADDSASGNLEQPSSWTWMTRVKADNLSSSSPFYRTVIAHDLTPFVVYDVNNELWRFEDDNGSQADVPESMYNVESSVRILCVRVDSNEALLEVYDESQSLVGSSSIGNPDTSYDGGTTYFGVWNDATRNWDGKIDPKLYQADSYLTDAERDVLLEKY